MQRFRFTFLSVGFALCLFGGMLAFLEVGRRLGIGEIAKHGAEARSGVGVVDAAVYSLLALIIGFTFSGAATRFDHRRELVAQEVNAIGTAWQRIEVLPAELQGGLRDRLRRYLDALLATYLNPSPKETLREAPALAQAQSDVWSDSVAACVSREGEPARMLLLPALNDMFGAVEKERLARRIHPPIVIYLMLGLTALAAALFAGYGMASGATHNWMYTLGVAATIAIAAYVIIDLEFPRLGLIRIDAIDKTLVELRETMI